MLYQVPSGSKSPGQQSGLATGFACWNALRFAISLVVPSPFTRNRLLCVPSRPCEQPAAASSPYSCPSRNFTSATPLTSEPIRGFVALEGNPPTTVERPPCASIFEIRALNPPVYGPASPTWAHCCGVVASGPP